MTAIKNGVTAYNAWNMVLDRGGKGIDNTREWAQNALLVADAGPDQHNAGVLCLPAYLPVRAPGAKVVGTQRAARRWRFKNPDGSLVAVMFNSGAANNSYVVSIGGKKLQFAMPASGWATLKYAP